LPKFWNFVHNAATEKEPESAELRIDGEIVDDDDVWIYEWYGISTISPNAFRQELKKFSGMPLTVWIDSYGGNVFAATGIYDALMEHRGIVTVKIDGKAMSVAIFMIHNPLCEVYGYASDLRKTADILDEVKEAIMNAYQIKTGKSRNKISALMEDESYMSAKTAIKEGFVDAMLYATEDIPDNVMNFMFNRHAVLNSTTEAFKRVVALQKPPEDSLPVLPPDPPPEDIKKLKAKLALELQLSQGLF
jgi:ATP-dependent Clp protease protease subunit